MSETRQNDIVLEPEVCQNDIVLRTDKQRRIAALLAQGYSRAEAARLAGYNSVNSAAKAIPKARRSLLAPLAGKAKKAVAQIVQGNPVGASTVPKASDVLHAAGMILERTDPVVQKVDHRSVNVNIDLTDQDRERFFTLLGLPAENPSDNEPLQ